MTYFSIILFLVIIFACHLVNYNYVTAIDVENLFGGYQARLNQFPYQVAIVAKNRSYSLNLICNGGIIAKNLILSSARCFVNDCGDFDDYQYLIITKTTSWKHIRGTEALINLIYLPSGMNYYLNDIAVAQLYDDLNIDNNLAISALNIPQLNESFSEKIGIVSGYGSILPPHLFTNDVLLLNLIRNEISILKYSRVQITNQSFCGPEHKHININKQFCGLMLTENPEQKWGICEKDIGSPLVFLNKIVGIAGINNKYCDDTVVGHAYSKVSAYSLFINSIIDGNPLHGTVIHHHRQHIVHICAPAA